MADIETLTENAAITVMVNSNQIDLTPKRFEYPKKDEQGNLIPRTLPALVLKATCQRQLHTNLGTYLLMLEVMLEANGDDTSEDTWNDNSTSIENVLLDVSLASKLTDAVKGYRCHGVVTRMDTGKVITDRHWQQKFTVMLWAGRTA